MLHARPGDSRQCRSIVARATVAYSKLHGNWRASFFEKRGLWKMVKEVTLNHRTVCLDHVAETVLRWIYFPPGQRLVWVLKALLHFNQQKSHETVGLHSWILQTWPSIFLRFYYFLSFQYSCFFTLCSIWATDMCIQAKHVGSLIKHGAFTSYVYSTVILLFQASKSVPFEREKPGPLNGAPEKNFASITSHYIHFSTCIHVHYKRVMN